jgi:hypothetical protein
MAAPTRLTLDFVSCAKGSSPRGGGKMSIADRLGDAVRASRSVH